MRSILRQLVILILGGSVAVSPLSAQRASIAADASIGLSGGLQRHAVSGWYPVAALGGRLSFDVGLRATWYGGEAGTYTNRGMVNGTYPNSLPISTAVLGLSAAVQVEVRLIGPVSAGFNLDLAGFATGRPTTSGALAASVQTGSLFLGGAPDVGALNSETYVAVRLTRRVVLRAGTSHYVTNYLVTNPATPGAPSVRYQKFATVPFAAMAVHF